jgi:hypothetical protein
MTESTARLRLSEAHERSVTTALMLLEQDLFLVASLVAADQVGIVVSTRTRLDARQREHMQRLIEEIRAEIAALAATFSLPHHVRDGRRIISGHLSERWADLGDTRPAKLGRYGRLDPALAAALDPPITRLTELVAAMCKEVEQ